MEHPGIRHCVCSYLTLAAALEIFPVADHICNNLIGIATIPHVAENIFNFCRVVLLSEPAFEGSSILVGGGDCTLFDEILPFYESLMDFLAVFLVLVVLRVPVDPLELIGCGISVWVIRWFRVISRQESS